jgi:two-component system, OmpR family, sensor histidine kinase KdpD
LIDAFAAQSALAIGRARLATEEERARAAAESDRLKSVFLASLSHDLRTPLTAIKVAAALLGTEVTSATGAGAVNDIDQEVDRLNRLVGNLLDLSRIEGGGLLLRRVPEDLPTLVGATIERLTPQLAGRPIVFQSEEIPLVPLDPLQIERVLINLLENAAKFSAADSPIAIAITASAEEVLLRLHNLGAPIPAAEQQQIFEKFHRLHRPAQIVDGAGLGLAICKGIIEGHGGRLWTANEAGGVAFYVALPRAQAATGSAIPTAVAS